MKTHEYYWMVLRRAFADTWAVYGWNFATLLNALPGVVGVVLGVYWRGIKEMINPIVDLFLMGFVPTAGCVIVVFMVKCFLAPAKIDREQRERIADLEKSIADSVRKEAGNFPKLSDEHRAIMRACIKDESASYTVSFGSGESYIDGVCVTNAEGNAFWGMRIRGAIEFLDSKGIVTIHFDHEYEIAFTLTDLGIALRKKLQEESGERK